MRKPLSDKERIGFMLDNIAELQSSISEISYEEYTHNILLRSGVTKLLQNICETSVYITDETKAKYPDVEWRKMKTMRNILIHEYFGIDYLVVWDTVINEIPFLKSMLLKIATENFGQ